jgi:hypothetical protein
MEVHDTRSGRDSNRLPPECKSVMKYVITRLSSMIWTARLSCFESQLSDSRCTAEIEVVYIYACVLLPSFFRFHTCRP